jgi:hypothetical protein
MCGAIPPLLQYISMAWCSVKKKNMDNFTFTFMESEGPLPCSQKSALFPFLNQMNPVHNFSPYFPKIYYNIILSSTLWSSEWSFHVFRPTFSPISHLPHACYMYLICLELMTIIFGRLYKLSCLTFHNIVFLSR